MLHIRHIHSLDLPELAPYRTMRYQRDHREQGIFVAESEKVVRRLIDSSLGVVSLLMMEEWLPIFEKVLACRTENIDVFVCTKKLLETLTGFPTYQGIMAVGKVPPPPSLDLFLQHSPHPLLLVAADAIANSQNMGALVRNCAAFGVHALLSGETCCSPFLRRAVGASTGTIFRLPSFEQANLAQTLQQLRKRGIRCIAAHPHVHGCILPEANLRSDCCIVVGSEGEGIRPAVLEHCDQCVAIPMPPKVDSLNVASATAVFLYEAARQRGSLLS